MKPLSTSIYKTITILIITIKINNIKAAPGSSKASSSKLTLPTEIELSFEVRNIACKDLLSKSDPMVITFEQIVGQNNWKEIHRTEVVKNKHNTQFLSKLVVTHRFEEKQPMRFDVFDSDSKKHGLDNHDFLGTVEFSLGKLVSNKLSTLNLKSRDGREHLGDLIITASEMGGDTNKLTFQISGFKLDKKNKYIGSSDPYFEIFKLADKGNYVKVYTSEYKINTTKPKWKNFEIPVWLLCNGNYERDLKFVCWDWNFFGSHSVIGEFHTNLGELHEKYYESAERNTPATFTLINKEIEKKKKSYVNSGEIHVDYFTIKPVITFIDYIQDGTQISCTVAIDFTESNGKPNTPYSHHRIKPYDSSFMNTYEQAIWSVVPIIEDYDSDKRFPVLGFGGDIGKGLSHDFFVNMTENPDCIGTAGVVEAYRECLKRVQLSGPTHFAPVINREIEIARTAQDGKDYFILLILTDGEIHDMPDTKKAVITASFLPISIIIVGIGQADFTNMETLDADTIPLKDERGNRVRDIVQFVPFHPYQNFDIRVGFSRLAKEVLAEIPQQFMGYMESKKILPRHKTIPHYYT